MIAVDPRELLAESREELARADGKASMLLSALGVIVGVIAAALLAGDWSLDRLDHPYRIIWWVGLGLTAAGSLALCLAVWPRLRHRLPGPSATYFDEIALLGSVEKVRAALGGTDAAERTLTQLVAISADRSAQVRPHQVGDAPARNRDRAPAYCDDRRPMTLLDDVKSSVSTHMAGTYETFQPRGMPLPEDIPEGAKAAKLTATSLFIDLRQSSDITNALRRQTAAKILKAYFSGAVRIVNANDGYVRSFNGDGMLALFRDEAAPTMP